MDLVLSSLLFALAMLSLILGVSCFLYACFLPDTLTKEQKMEARIEWGIFTAGCFAVLAMMLFAMCYH